jgi:ABC-type Fe3+-hydroxamate transport system substrate-binding protein
VELAGILAVRARYLGTMRVVSLLPSATELLVEIGGAELLVGRSHECDFPPSLGHLPVLTKARTHGGDSAAIDAEVSASLASGQSLYELDERLLADLAPDVILTQDLCAVCSIDLRSVERIAASLPSKPRILSLDPKTVFDVFDDLLKVGEAVGRAEAAERAMVALRARYWSAVDFVNPYVPGPEVLFLEWCDPPFVGGHWTPGLIEAAGGRHSLNKLGAKSRRVSPEEILEAAPERVIVCPCGFDLARTRVDFTALEKTRWWPLLPAVIDSPRRSIALVDGNQMFNRPGPRLVDAFEWLVGWLNLRDELVPKGFPVEYR